MWKVRFVACAWLLASAGYFVTTLGHLFRLPEWDPSVGAHLARYPSEVPVLIVAFIVTLISVGTLTGNLFAARVLCWCSWFALAAAGALFIAFVLIAILESEAFEPLGYVFTLTVVAGSALSVAVLSKDRSVA